MVDMVENEQLAIEKAGGARQNHAPTNGKCAHFSGSAISHSNLRTSGKGNMGLDSSLLSIFRQCNQ
jgi:hypothetical protein